MTTPKTDGGFTSAQAARVIIPTVTAPALYYSGRYLLTICVTCRRTHHALKNLEEVPNGTFFDPTGRLVLHEYRSDLPLHCQLCGTDITGRDENPAASRGV